MKKYLVRYSEIGLKTRKVRGMMETRLIDNALKVIHSDGKNATSSRERGRIYFDSEDDLSDQLSRVMGIKSFSEVITYTFETLDDIIEKGVEICVKNVENRTFAVNSRRSGNHTFTSMDIDRKLGEALLPFSKGVDIHSPDVRIELEIREKTCYFLLDHINGPGGLPVGTEGKMISLISGGIDSPVATWLMLKRGSPVDMLFISLADPVDTRQFLEKAHILYRKWYSGYNPRIFIVDASRLVDQYLYTGKMKYANVSFKKILYNIGEMIARREKAYGIITGESSGQVSSQTPENLFELSRNMEFPVIRPLIGMDKDWIMDMARSIGTFNNDSSEEFCALFSEKAITKIKRDELEEDMKRLSDYTPSEEEILEIRGTDIENVLYSMKKEKDFRIKSVEELPDHYVIADVRDPLSFKKSHPEGALNINQGNLKTFIDSLKQEDVIVFYCKKGLQSAGYAGKLRNKGYNAYYTDEKVMENQTKKKVSP